MLSSCKWVSKHTKRHLLYITNIARYVLRRISTHRLALSYDNRNRSWLRLTVLAQMKRKDTIFPCFFFHLPGRCPNSIKRHDPTNLVKSILILFLISCVVLWYKRKSSGVIHIAKRSQQRCVWRRHESSHLSHFGNKLYRENPKQRFVLQLLWLCRFFHLPPIGSSRRCSETRELETTSRGQQI